MNIATLVLRILLGAWMLQAGLNHFFHFYELPPFEPMAQTYMDAITVTGFYEVAKVMEIVGGLCLLANRFVPAGVALLMPVSFTIFWLNFVVVHEPWVKVSGVVTLGINVFLMLAYSKYFMPLLTMHASVSGADGLKQWQAAWGSEQRSA